MKKFIFTILCVSVFFIGLGSLIDKVGAELKSDERALILLKQARTAIGGESNIKNVKSLTANGKVIHIFNINGADKAQTGDFEMALALPNQFNKMVQLRMEEKSEGNLVKTESRNEKNVIIERSDNSGGEQMKMQKGRGEPEEDAEFLHTMLGLFLTVPDRTNVEYSYAGSGDVDGSSCEIVEAKTNDSTAKLYLSKSNNMPLMISYRGAVIPRIAMLPEKMRIPDAPGNEPADVVIQRDKEPMPAMATAEINVKFFDYKTVGAVLLPFRWTQTANGKTDETVTIENYTVNPLNIEEKFRRLPEKVRMKTEKSQ